MKKYKAQWYPSPIDIPEKRVGRMQVKHRVIPTGEEVIIVGHRQALLRGIKAIRGITKEPLRIHQLLERGEHTSLWMSDLPEELNQIGELVQTVRPGGNVLVGGLGLGILAATVARLDAVMKVVVVERSRDVIRLCANKALYRTVRSDIMKYLQTTKEEFDYYLLDTWAGTNEGEWWDTVMPLRRIIRQRWGTAPTIHCWAEDIMWGQIFRALTNPLTVPHWHTTYLPVPMSEEDAMIFLNMVGTAWWEDKYGKLVDRYNNEVKTKRRLA